MLRTLYAGANLPLGLRHGDPRIRRIAVRVAMEEKRRDALERMKSDADPNVRQAAIYGLAVLANEERLSGFERYRFLPIP